MPTTKQDTPQGTKQGLIREEIKSERRNEMSFIEIVTAVVFGIIFIRFLSIKAISNMIVEKMEDLAKRIKAEEE